MVLRGFRSVGATCTARSAALFFFAILMSDLYLESHVWNQLGVALDKRWMITSRTNIFLPMNSTLFIESIASWASCGVSNETNPHPFERRSWSLMIDASVAPSGLKWSMRSVSVTANARFPMYRRVGRGSSTACSDRGDVGRGLDGPRRTSSMSSII